MKISVKDLESLNSKLKEKNSSYETNIGEYYQHIEQVKYDWYAACFSREGDFIIDCFFKFRE